MLYITAYSGSALYLLRKTSDSDLLEEPLGTSTTTITSTPKVPTQKKPVVPLTSEQNKILGELYEDVFNIAYSIYGNILRNRGVTNDSAKSLAGFAMLNGIKTFSPDKNSSLKSYLVDRVIYFWKMKWRDESPRHSIVRNRQNNPLVKLFIKTKEKLEQVSLRSNISDEEVIEEMERKSGEMRSDLKNNLLRTMHSTHVLPLEDISGRQYQTSENLRKDKIDNRPKEVVEHDRYKNKVAAVVEIINTYAKKLDVPGKKKQADALRLVYDVDLDLVDERIKPFIQKYKGMKNRSKMVGKIYYDAGIMGVKNIETLDPEKLDKQLRNNANMLLQKGYISIGELMSKDGITPFHPFKASAISTSLTPLMGSSSFLLKF